VNRFGSARRMARPSSRSPTRHAPPSAVRPTASRPRPRSARPAALGRACPSMSCSPWSTLSAYAASPASHPPGGHSRSRNGERDPLHYEEPGRAHWGARPRAGDRL